MRTTAKPNAKQGNISAASAYRCGVKSAATDLEALIDAYGVVSLLPVMLQIEKEIAAHGNSYSNSTYNLHLNSLPLPLIRKQPKTRSERK